MGKTTSGLIEYAKHQVSRPYWFGTYGNIADQKLLDYKKKQYPNNYKVNDFTSQFGQKVHDCVGLVKGYLWSETPDSAPKYVAKQDVSASGMYGVSTVKGTFDNFPYVPGTCVYKSSTDSPSKIHHIGVYIGDGYVIEAKGHSYGTVKTKFSNSWKFWSYCPWIDIDTKSETVTKKPSKSEMATLRRGSKGYNVMIMQQRLVSKGYDIGSCGVDGSFGPATEKAVVVFQKDVFPNDPKEWDGICGPKTWGKLMNN